MASSHLSEGEAMLEKRKTFSAAMRRFQRDVDKRVFKKDYIILKAVNQIPEKSQDELMDSNIGAEYDIDGHKIKTAEELEKMKEKDFWDMSDSEDSMEAEQRITLHHGGAAMRAEFERRTEVANDIQKAIKKKEKEVVSGEQLSVVVRIGVGLGLVMALAFVLLVLAVVRVLMLMLV